MIRRASMRPVLSVLLVFGLALPVVACGDADGDAEVAADTVDAERLGEMGGRIYLEPEQAESILQEADLDRETFAARVREVSADPERAREYAEAFERVADEEAPADALPTGTGVDDDRGADEATD